MDKKIRILYLLLICILLILCVSCATPKPTIPAQYLKPEIERISKKEARKLYRGALEDYLRQPLWTAERSLGMSRYGNHVTFPNLVKHFASSEFIGAQEQDNGYSILFLYRDKKIFSDTWSIIINQFSEKSLVKFANMPDRNHYVIRITNAEFTFGAQIDNQPVVQHNTWSFKYPLAHSYGAPAIPLRRFGGSRHNNFLDPVCNAVYHELQLTNCNDVVLVFASEAGMIEFATILLSAFPFLEVE